MTAAWAGCVVLASVGALSVGTAEARSQAVVIFHTHRRLLAAAVVATNLSAGAGVVAIATGSADCLFADAALVAIAIGGAMVRLDAATGFGVAGPGAGAVILVFAAVTTPAGLGTDSVTGTIKVFLAGLRLYTVSVNPGLGTGTAPVPPTLRWCPILGDGAVRRLAAIGQGAGIGVDGAGIGRCHVRTSDHSAVRRRVYGRAGVFHWYRRFRSL